VQEPGKRSRTALYAAIGSVFSHYEFDPDSFTLEKKSEFEIPLNVQYAWMHPSRPILYVGASARQNRDNPGSFHQAYSLAVDEASGALSMLGDPVTLPERPTHVSCDVPGQHLMAAYTHVGGLTVNRINDDGSLGAFVEQRPDLDPGSHTHQTRATFDGRFVIAPARGKPADRGWWAHKGRQKTPGSINVFAYKDGVFGEQSTLAIGDGYQFGPRHLDFHPTGPWVYVSVEIQNEVIVYRLDAEGLSPEPLQRLSSLENPDDILVHQGLGTVHVHPHGHVIYVANRGHMPIPQRNGTKVVDRELHENSIVVYAIDPQSGLLTMLQRIGSGGWCPRTFGIDPTGRMLIVANGESHWVKDGRTVKYQSANLATFKIFEDGRLELKNTYELDLPAGKVINWSGIIAF
jgi:6-phosphogluconolactonase